MISSYADLHRFFRERLEIARDAYAAASSHYYLAQLTVYRLLAASFSVLVESNVDWDDMHTRWAIADVLLEAVVNLVPEAVEEESA